MKKWVLLALLLSLFTASYADNIVHCPASNPNCISQPLEDAPTEDLPTEATFAVPVLEEFYVPLQWVSTPIGTLFGSVSRQKKEIAVYWQDRQTQLDQANQRCLGLNNNNHVRSCLQTVREAEIRKSQHIADYNKRRMQQQFTQSLYTQQAFSQMGAQIQNQARQQQLINTLNQPKRFHCTSNAYGYGTTTNCTSY